MLIELGLEERPDAVANPWNLILETGDTLPQPLPEGTKVINIFDDIGEGRTLLILGEPGSGKTTTLLELTRDLIARAEQDINLLIPVVFNLSSWANKRQKIADWLVEELNTKYDVPTKIGQSWVTQQQLLPLLDGLDEVKAEYRDDCIVALNQFKQEYGAELVVCSRIKDYEALSNRLNFQSAVYIRLLTLEEICNYLDSVGTDFRGLRTLIVEDRVLQELAQSPLMLNIMTLAYQGVAVEDLPKTEALKERRKQLFDDYIQKMFKRPNRSKGDLQYSKIQRKSRYWLILLAQRMVQQSQTIFLIEQMQPSWLQKPWKKLIYTIVVGMIYAIAFGLSVGLGSGISYGLNIGIVIGLIFGFGFGLSAWLVTIGGVDRIVEVIVNAIAKVICKLIGREDINRNYIQIINTQIPNQGIKESARRGLNAGIIGGLVGGIISHIYQPDLFIIAVLCGLTYGATTQGRDCIIHFSLRLILCWNNYIPWNYARFLDYAAERILLQKVGGGYIFIHRMLMEHFAQMELESISRR